MSVELRLDTSLVSSVELLLSLLEADLLSKVTREGLENLSKSLVLKIQEHVLYLLDPAIVSCESAKTLLEPYKFQMFISCLFYINSVPQGVESPSHSEYTIEGISNLELSQLHKQLMSPDLHYVEFH